MDGWMYGCLHHCDKVSLAAESSRPPTLVLFLSLQSGGGHSQWAWPLTSMQVAPKLHSRSSHDVGASGPARYKKQ